MKWVDFDQSKWANQQLPTARKYLLVQVASKPDEGLPPAVAVGYMRFAAGDKNSPTFTIPGVGGEVVAWCDCLGDDFIAPLWPGAHKNPEQDSSNLGAAIRAARGGDTHVPKRGFA